MSSIIRSSVREPFDPSTIKSEVRNTTVGILVEMLQKDLIDLNPDFQRSGELWNDGKKSQLIESILLGLPLPSFYFYVDETRKKWVVIDGLQRLCSLRSFMVDKTLSLQGLEFLDKEKYEIPFDRFDYFDQLALKMHPVTLNILTGNASAEARYIIFQRVNSKGTLLNPTEMRNALYQGRATQLLSAMVEDEVFKALVSSRISTKRMKDKEFASRFLTFYLSDYHEYDGNLDITISKMMDDINTQFSDDDVESIINTFSLTVSLCKELLGEDAFRKPITESENRKNQISLTVFEMLTVSIAKLNVSDQSKLKSRKAVFCQLYHNMFLDSRLQKYLSTGTGKAAAITYRFGKIEEVLMNTLKS